MNKKILILLIFLLSLSGCKNKEVDIVDDSDADLNLLRTVLDEYDMEETSGMDIEIIQTSNSTIANLISIEQRTDYEQLTSYIDMYEKLLKDEFDLESQYLETRTISFYSDGFIGKIINDGEVTWEEYTLDEFLIDWIPTINLDSSNIIEYSLYEEEFIYEYEFILESFESPYIDSSWILEQITSQITIDTSSNTLMNILISIETENSIMSFSYTPYYGNAQVIIPDKGDQ